MNKLIVFILPFIIISFENKANETFLIQKEQIQFWNHAAIFPKEYKGLIHNLEEYTPKIIANNEGTQVQITLIKKLSNWHQQHSNGLKINFNHAVLTFGDLEAIKFSLSLNEVTSVIPSKEELYQRYHVKVVSGLIQKSWLDDLFSEYGVLNIKLFGEHHENQAIETVIANLQLPINAAMVNHHEKIVIPMTKFDFHQQKNWQEQAVLFDEIKTIKVLGMLITAETDNEKTLRSYLQDSYSESVKEKYLELAINLKGLALVAKGQTK